MFEGTAPNIEILLLWSHSCFVVSIRFYQK
jgi:hypothetical protein